MIYKEVSFTDFCDSFSDSYKNNFSYEGKRALYDYLDESSEDMGVLGIELDTIALCCEYTEFDSAYGAMQQYQPEDMPTEGVEGDDLVEIAEKEEAEALQWLQNRTQVIEVGNGAIIISDF